MGSGPLDQMVGLAIDRVPDSLVVMDEIYQQPCGKHRANMVNTLALRDLSIGAPHARRTDIGKGRVTVNSHQEVCFGEDRS